MTETAVRADYERALEIARLAAGSDWHWNATGIESFCREVGWTVLEPADGVMRLATDLAVNRPELRPKMDFGISGHDKCNPGKVLELDVVVSDVVVDNSVQQALRIARMYAELCERMIGEFRDPASGPDEYTTETTWQFRRRRLVLAVDADRYSISLRIRNPQYQRWLERDRDFDRKVDDGWYDKD